MILKIIRRLVSLELKLKNLEVMVERKSDKSDKQGAKRKGLLLKYKIH